MKKDENKPKNAQVDADYSLEAVPESARKGFWNMFFVMLGFTFFSASMSVGAKLGNGLDLSGFFWACLIGGVILSAYCGILAYIGSETGMTMDLLCRRTFGEKGSYLSSAILGFTQIGWFGVCAKRSKKAPAGAPMTITHSPLQRFPRNHPDKLQYLLLLTRGELFHGAQGFHQF